MYSLKRPMKNIFILSFLVFSGISIYYMNARNVTVLQPFVMYLGFADNQNNIFCHYIDENDALPSAEDSDFIPRPNSIFFHETSCSGGLNSRQACGIESAARAHPNRTVYVMFSAPVSHLVYQRSCIANLRGFHNIRFARVHITDYAKNTPLEAMVANGPFDNSQWRVEHTSDVLRYLTLYKWGGVYLDTDMLVVKSLTPLGDNWVAREGTSLVNAAAIAISMDHLGRKLAEAVINEVNTTYRPDLWAHNGPGAITRVLHRMCNTSDLTEWSTTTCQGRYYNNIIDMIIFLLFMNDLTPDIQEEAPWCMLFANDIVLVGEDGPEIQSRLENWQQKLENVGLKISRSKTEYMFCDQKGGDC